MITEDFTTTTYKDAGNTTADWDTVNDQLSLLPTIDQYGDGSDGDLHVTGTTNINLNQKYQYNSILIDVGATLTTTGTSGAVLYLLCKTSCVVNGNIILNNKVGAGDRVDTITIDGVV